MYRSRPITPRAWLLAAAAALPLAGPAPAPAQGACPGASFAASSPTAEALGASLAAAHHEGVVVHARVAADTARLIVENSNPHPVEVRFDVDLLGSGPTRTLRGRCVRVRNHEFGVDTTPATAIPYPSGTLRTVRVRNLRVKELESAPEPAPATPPPAAAPTAAGPLPEEPAPREADPPPGAPPGEPAMALVATLLRWTFGAFLTAVGAMLLVANAAALYLLLVRSAEHLLRRLLAGAARRPDRRNVHFTRQASCNRPR